MLAVVATGTLGGQMNKQLKFGVGSPTGPRANTWTVKASQNDVYVLLRRAGGDIKVSLHENGTWRIALTSQHLEKRDRLQVPAGADPRMAKEWPRPPAIMGVTHAISIVVPWFEVIERPGAESSPGVIWTPAPPRDTARKFEVLLLASNVLVQLDPRRAEPHILGELALLNGERVMVLWSTPQISDEVQQQLDRVLSAEVLENGQPVSDLHMLCFSIHDGLGQYVDLRLPDVVTFPRAALLDGEACCPRCDAPMGTPEARAALVAALSGGTTAGRAVRHMGCGQYFRARLLD